MLPGEINQSNKQFEISVLAKKRKCINWNRTTENSKLNRKINQYKTLIFFYDSENTFRGFFEI